MESQTSYILLEKKLRATNSSWERLPILIEISLASPDAFPKAETAWNFAQEALLLARQLNDQFWIACSLRAIGQQALRTANYSEALYHLRQASRIFAQINDPRMKAETDHRIAMTCIFTGEFSEALAILTHSLPLFQSIGNSQHIIRTYNYLGRIYRAIGEHGTSLTYYRRALALAFKSGRETDIALLYQDLALIYKELKERAKHRNYLLKSLAVFHRIHSREGIATVAANISSMYLENGEHSRAKKYVLLSGRLCRQLGFTANEGLAWGQLAHIYWQGEDIAKATRCYRKGLTLLRQGQNKILHGTLYGYFGTMQLETGRPERAVKYLRKGLKIIAESGYAHYESDLHEKLSTAYEQVGNTAQALWHHKEYIRIRNAHLSAQKALEAGRAEMQLKIQSLEKTLRRERFDNFKLQQTIEQKETELRSFALSLIQTEEKIQQQRGSRQEGRSTLRAVGAESDLLGKLSGNWEAFARQFHKVHYNFYTSLVRSYPDLTATEIKVCSLIRIGLSSKEIADILCIAKKTVDKHRLRIHKKMELISGSSLSGFIAHM